MPHDEQGNAIQDEAFMAKAAEISTYLGRLENREDPLVQRFARLCNDWNEISQELTDKFGTALEEGADWQDFPSDLAMKAKLFWWTWGN